MYLFAQVSCVQTDEMLMDKKVWGLAAACLGLAICMVFSNSMSYLLNMDEINDKLYDMKLVTVSDYAVMGQIPAAMYERYKMNLQLTGQTGSPIVLFKDALTDSIELQLQQKKNIAEEDAQIADLTFSFDNSRMLSLLHLRAAALKSTKFDIAAEAGNKLTDEKNRNYDKITRPNGFFCTFRHESGQHTALELKDDLDFEGLKLRGVKRACEPSDLIWENKEVSPKQR